MCSASDLTASKWQEGLGFKHRSVPISSTHLFPPPAVWFTVKRATREGQAAPVMQQAPSLALRLDPPLQGAQRQREASTLISTHHIVSLFLK